MKEIMLKEVKNGSAFKLGDLEFIKFSDENDRTVVVTKETVFDSRFGENNNLAESTVLDRLKKEFLPKVTELIGEENILEFETDLTTLDGLKPYDVMKSKISLPTFDFYRKNVEIFDKYKLDDWWWLATPDSAKPHYDPIWISCVSPSGSVDSNDCISELGVRPFLNFVSSILVSCEE